MDGEKSRWRTFGERVIYDNPWVWLGQIDVEIPGGERFWHHMVRAARNLDFTMLPPSPDNVPSGR